jgi:hypothetical protein
MALLARRNLFHDKIRLAVTLTGIVVSVVLITIQFGLFTEFATTTSNIIDHSVALIAIVGLAAAFFLAGKGRTSPTGAVVKADSEPMALVAAPGRVEPVSENRRR